ncbi:hypothetical protein ACK36D_04710 [Aeromonas veronii]
MATATTKSIGGEVVSTTAVVHALPHLPPIREAVGWQLGSGKMVMFKVANATNKQV